jgi:leucine dehydrogenase
MSASNPSVFELARELGHERVLIVQEPAVGLRAVIAIHDTTLGAAVGGTRMRPYPSFDEAIEDALRLSHAMTSKTAFAGMPYGGGKAVIVGDPLRDKTPDLLLAYARAVDELGGRFLTGGDMGIHVEDLKILLRGTRHVGCTPSNARVDASDLTAIGVLAAMNVVAERLGKPLSACTVALQGVGEVGGRLAEHLAGKGARLIVTDTVGERVDSVVRATGARAVAPEEIFDIECDLFSPNAAGGVITPPVVDRLRCAAVVGAANNPLASMAVGEELARRGMLYAPDFVVNAGGVLSVLFETGVLDEAGIVARVERIGADLAALLQRAEREGAPAFRVADRVVAERLAAARAVVRQAPPG